MNYVALDAGNTHLRIASVNPDTLTVSPPLRCTYNELAGHLAKLGEKEPVSLAVSTVVDKARSVLSQLLEEPFIDSVSYVDPTKNSSLTFEYSVDTLGPDRVADACAALALFPGEDVVVIDSGTATTVDMIRGDRTFLGGVIMPGLKVQAESLVEKTDKLPPVHIYDMYPVKAPTTTEEAIETGLILSVLGGIERAVAEAQEQLSNPRVVGCGGGWQLLHGSTKLAVTTVPELTLLGTTLSCIG